MAKEIKFTNEEVGGLDQLRQDVSNIFTKLGQLSIEKKRRIDEIVALEDELLNQTAYNERIKYVQTIK